MKSFITRLLAFFSNERGATSIDPMNISTTQPQYLLSVYYDKRLLERLKPVPVMYEMGQKRSLPKGEGKVVKWSRFQNLGDAGVLSEGTRPTPLVVSAVNVTATLAQYGDYTAVSDFVEMTVISSVVEGSIDVFATQAGSSIDKIVRYALFGEKTGSTYKDSNTFNISAWQRAGLAGAGSTSTFSALHGKTIGFPVQLCGALSANAGRFKAFSSVAGLSTYAQHKFPLAVADIRKAVQTLQEANVPTFEDGYYIGFIHPTAAAGLKRDTQWQNWNQYSGELTKATMYKGELGEVERVRFVSSTLVMKRPLVKGNVLSACFTTIVGKNAYGVVDYDGGQHVYVKQPNNYDTSNPLNQWTTIGWKITMAARILESSRGVHIMSI